MCHWCQSMWATTTPTSCVTLCHQSTTRARPPAACDYPASLTDNAPLHKRCSRCTVGPVDTIAPCIVDVCGQCCLKLQVQTMSPKVRGVVYWFALQRGVFVQCGTKDAPKDQSLTPGCVFSCCALKGLFPSCLWKSVLLSKMQCTLSIVSHINTNAQKANCTYKHTHSPFFPPLF